MNRTAAPNTTAGSVTAAPAELPTRPLWQVPLFFVGVLSLLSAWSLRHCEANGSNRFQVRELSEVRRQLGKPAANIDSVIALAEKVLEQPELLGDHLGEAHFLLGTALLRRTEPDYPAARIHLQEAQKCGVDPKDAPYLTFRLAKALYYTGGDPQQVVTNLNSSLDQVEEQEKADGCNLLTEANLRLPVPDLKAALAANEKLPQRHCPGARIGSGTRPCPRCGVAAAPQPSRGCSRLALQHVGSAVPAIQTRAYQLQGQSYQFDEKWTEAASFYEKALPGMSEGNPERPNVLYQLGLCYRKLTNLEEARRRWDECGKTTTNPNYSQAAIFSLVEILLVDSKHHAEALQYLSQVVHDIKTPTDWHNPVIDVGQVRDAFEQSIGRFREAREYDLAIKLTEPYERLAPPGRTALLRADIHAQWGRDCRKPPAGQVDAPPQVADEEKARDHLCQAGSNYSQTAELVADPAARADLLWNAMLCFREAPNNAQAIVLLRSFAKAYPRDPRISECWYLLGETYRVEKNDAEAERAYQDCITSDAPNHFIFLAKHQVALYLIQRNQLDNAEELLESSLKDIRGQPDAESLERTLFTLGEIAFRKHKYNNVVLKLAEAVFKDESRKNPMVVRAHYYLAKSYYELATIENGNAQLGGDKLAPDTYQHYLEQYRMYMTKAGQVFDTLAWMLENQPEASNQFADEDKEKVKIEVAFKVAECSFFLGKYDEALKRYEALATKYEKTPDGIGALGGTVRCLASLHRDQDMIKRLMEIDQGLDVIKDPKIRKEWHDWVEIASRRPAASSAPR